MKPATFRAFMAREYPELETNPLWIHSIFGVQLVELTRSSRGSLTGIRAFGSNAVVEPTEDNLKAAIEAGLREQAKGHREIAATLEGIRKGPATAAERNAEYARLTAEIKRLTTIRRELPPIADAWEVGYKIGTWIRDDPDSDAEYWADVEEKAGRFYWATEHEAGDEATLQEAQDATDAALKRAGVLL